MRIRVVHVTCNMQIVIGGWWVWSSVSLVGILGCDMYVVTCGIEVGEKWTWRWAQFLEGTQSKENTRFNNIIDRKSPISRVEWGCEKNSSRSGWRGVPSHKRVRVHNHFNSVYLILKLMVMYQAYIRNSWYCLWQPLVESNGIGKKTRSCIGIPIYQNYISY